MGRTRLASAAAAAAWFPFVEPALWLTDNNTLKIYAYILLLIIGVVFLLLSTFIDIVHFSQWQPGRKVNGSWFCQ